MEDTISRTPFLIVYDKNVLWLRYSTHLFTPPASYTSVLGTPPKLPPLHIFLEPMSLRV